jgi:hypothetical protein
LFVVDLHVPATLFRSHMPLRQLVDLLLPKCVAVDLFLKLFNQSLDLFHEQAVTFLQQEALMTDIPDIFMSID